MHRGRVRRVRGALTLPSAVACLGALLLASAAPATDKLDPVGGARRLRQLAGRLAPLPDSGSGITRDVGFVAIVEHDGSNYDAIEADGVTPNYAARAAVARRFYEAHGDFYDFLVVFTNFEFQTKEAVAFHNLVRNDVRGIGLPIVDNGPPFGSPGRLKGYVDMGALSRYARWPLSLDPADPGFTRTLNILAHETAHQWMTEAHFRDATGTISTDLLKGDGHWSYLLDSDASVMYGADWVGHDDGSHVAARVQDTYFNLDLYLMGLLEAAKVTPFTLLRNSAVSRNAIPVEGAAVTGAPETVTVDQVIAAEGPRRPSFQTSPKAFRMGFVFLTRPGTDPSAEDLQSVERVRQFFAGHFFALTRGVGIADTTLAEAPPSPRAGAPDLDKALAWLLAQQLPDGRWEDSGATAVRDTSEALIALLQTGHQSDASYQHGRGWTASTAPPNVDFVSRRAIALAPAFAATTRAETQTAILAQQNVDGGFGAAAGYESDAFDTALALRALKALGSPLGSRVRHGLQALAALRSPGGGWSIVSGGGISTLVTAHALLAAQDWAAAPEGQALLAPGLGALLARQNPDHGFGESPSTPYATALAVAVLLRSPSTATEAVEGAIGWLEAAQLADGSWEDSRFQTSLVLATLKGSVAANLLVPADSLVLNPAAPKEGEPVHVTARIRNSGRSPAGANHARLFDGDPQTGESIAEAAVPSLAPNEEATVSFEYSTADRAGDHTLYVVADSAGEVSEGREDDNATARAVHVEGLLPDLVIGPGDVDVTPYPPEEGETVHISVRIANGGQKAAGSSRLLVRDGSPRQGGRLLGQAAVPPLAVGESAVLVLPWNTTGARGDHLIFAVANADFAVPESIPDNDEQSIAVTVTAPMPPGPDLNVTSVRLDPSSLTRLPESIGVEVLVRNLGRDAATSSVALYDGDPGAAPPLTQWTVSLEPRSLTRLTATVSVAAAGDRTLVAVADPDGTLAERDENNNRASALLADPHNTFDVEILPADLRPSATDVVVGDTLGVTARVRNRGTAPVTDVPVILGLVTDSGLTELARATISLDAGTAATVTLSWTTSLAGDPVPLAVRVDPFDLLPELSESNNTAPLPVRIRPSSLANLAISGADITFQPDPPREGATATVSAVVHNTSPVAAGPFTVRFHRGDPDAGGVLIGESRVSGLSPLTTAMVSVAWSLVDVRGAQGIFVLADALGEVEEYDEADNRGFRAFRVLGLPDLVLTAGDMVLDPRYPRAGEPVTVHATVRNLGALLAAASTLRAVEGEPPSGTVIGEVPIPALPPGAAATLDVAWTPSSPPGERTLTLVADAGGIVREQDEGNNQARRSVVVQNADLFLTEAYFSPDGDGVRDETTLAYRATGSVRVVVSNERGQRVRTLAESAPSSGVLTWDGRDDRGRLLEDAAYVFTLTGETGVVRGRTTAVLDTNRRPIYDAAGTGLIATTNLTCALPDDTQGPVFMPSEDAALFLVKTPAPGFPVGLVRVSLDGSYEYVAMDPWYGGATFPVPRSDFITRSAPVPIVSPDGRELLLAHGEGGDLYAVDLLAGGRRRVSQDMRRAAWSPDGRFIAGSNLVLSREGTLVGELPAASIFSNGWVWSPDSERLADGNRIVRRDGTDLRTIAMPAGVAPHTIDTAWRGDGKVVSHFGSCGDGCTRLTAWRLDPDAGTATALSWMDDVGVAGWSPDGGRALYTANFMATVVREDGSSPLRLLPFDVTLAPRGATGAYRRERSPAQSALCNGPRTDDIFTAANLQNLTADFVPTRLPANNGIVLRGTVSDRNLDHYQLEYARQEEPAVWHPVGPASEIPIVDDVLAVWVPAAPGSYLLRLRAYDRAGNARTRTRIVAWDRFPALANITQSELLISPNGDGVRDDVTFSYLVMEPTRVEVRVVGPERSGPDALPPPVVRAFGVEDPDARSFTWDGRDDSGAVVPDGRYTVFVDDLPFRLEVDATPPDIAFAEGDLQTAFVQRPLGTCGADPADQGALTAERRWHVVDDHLKVWSLGGHPAGDALYEPETDEAGQIVYDENGVPRASRVNGRAVDRRERFDVIGDMEPSAQLVAEDYAGNRSTIAVLPVEEALWILDARVDPCNLHTTLQPPIEAKEPVHALTVRTVFRVAETITHEESEEVTVRFQFQPKTKAVGPWTDAPAFPGRKLLSWEADFIQLGFKLGNEYRGRFVTESRGRTFASQEFFFRPCDDYLALSLGVADPVPDPDLLDYPVLIESAVHEPLVRAELTVTTLDAELKPAGFKTTVIMDRMDPATFRKTVRAPRASCDGVRVAFAAKVWGESGREYQSDGTCARLALVTPECPCGLALRQRFAFCDASPNALTLRYSADSEFTGAILRLERGPDDAPTVMTEVPMGLERDVVLDVSGLAEGILPVRGRIIVPGDPELACASVRLGTLIDRTPPTLSVLQPAEGALICGSPDPVTGLEVARLTVQPGDQGREVALEATEFRAGQGPWRSFVPSCPGTPPGTRCPGTLPTGTPSSRGWDITGLPEGDLAVRLKVCDQAGNKTTSERSVSIARHPPTLALVATSPATFSPNADGRHDETTITLRTLQTLRLTVQVRRGTGAGALVRTLASDQQFLPGDIPFAWDGHDTGGEVVPDGPYVVLVAAAEPCGRAASLSATVIVDTAPPTAIITRPVPAEAVRASVDVRGIATDPHFLSYELAYGPGPTPTAWTVVGGAGGEVSTPEGLLGRWDTPSDEGTYTLRLRAQDVAGNQSSAYVTVTVGRRLFLDHLGASPAAFSPNGDGRRDTTTLEYGLVAAGRVTLQVRSREGSILRRLDAGGLHDAGTHALVWDGQTDGGLPAPEAELVVWVRVEEPGGGAAPQEATIGVILDRTPPLINLDRPPPGSFVARSAVVHGSIADPRLASYVVTATPPGASPLELARGAQARSSEDLAPLSGLGDGSFVLSVVAEDTAENRARVDVPITVDSVAPGVALLVPAGGAVLLKNATPIDVIGNVTDEHLEGWTLGFGSGPDPAILTEIAGAATGGTAIHLASWSASSLPDGSYTLVLDAADKAGQTGQARRTVVLDGHPPLAEISSPVGGASIGREIVIVGTARDTNLQSWRLESAPGPSATAFQWSPVASGTVEVAGGPLAHWAPLPPDGVQTLRLTVLDQAGLSASARVTVTIDTIPPAAPTGLAAEIVRTGGPTADIHLIWTANTEPDLTGYRLSRDGVELTPENIRDPRHLDPSRPEGAAHYSVVAVDRAGNVSAPAQITVRVDLTAPIVDIQRPSTGSSLSGSVDVTGTAFSVADFREYRLLVGAGASPVSWTLLRRSTVPVAAGQLGNWTAVGDGPYVLALEAEDLSGNLARATTPVFVDNQAPLPPVLTSVTIAPDPASLASTWTPSPSSDTGGYLVYRNGHIANAVGIVTGSLRAYRVPGPSYGDAALPDGRHCYRIVAMDEAENLSPPSNEICRDLDNGPPRATIVQPGSGARFQYPIRVLAGSVDLDLASVQFQIKRVDVASWKNLGTADTAEPYEMALDPAALTLGDYELRAVATDRGGRVDPDPAPITVTYGDGTPPARPRDLTAHVDAADVQLTWSPGHEPDLEGYRVYRDHALVAHVPVSEATAFADPGVALGRHDYEVTATDQDGNESVPSDTAEALVYGISLDVAFPVTAQSPAAVSGRRSHEGTTVQVFREHVVVAEAPGTEDTFTVPGIALLPGGNALHARGRDAQGNRSIPSNEAVLILNERPAALTGLASTVQGHDVSLSWNAVGDADLFGYVVRRGHQLLTGSSLHTEASISASSSRPGFAPEAAFDGNVFTAWLPAAGSLPADWSADFAAPILIDRISIRFPSSASDDGVTYRIEGRWEGRYLPLVRNTIDAHAVVDYVLPAPFATSGIRIVLESGRGIAEVTLSKRQVVPAGTTAFADPGVADGFQDYGVAAIDRYGAEGPAGTVQASVGDVSAPAAPTGLVAIVEDRDVVLSWNANSEPDLGHYVLLRDGVRITTTTATTHRDPGLPNGRYGYTVLAADAAGNESPESDPAFATVDAPEPAPGAPAILFPTDAAHPVSLEATRTDVRGRADPGSLVSLELNGVLTAITRAEPGFVDGPSVDAPPSAVEIAVSKDGRQLAFGFFDEERARSLVRVVDVTGGHAQDLDDLAYEGLRTPRFTADGRHLAVLAFGSDHGSNIQHLLSLDLDTGKHVLIEGGAQWIDAAAWSPDGHRIALVKFADGEFRLQVRDLAAATTTTLATAGRPFLFIRWSPDGTQIAVHAPSPDADVYELSLFDAASGTETVVPDHASAAALGWSPDSRRLAYTSAAAAHLRIAIYDLDQRTVSPVTAESTDAFDPRFDRENAWLSFSRVHESDDGPAVQTAVARRIDTGDERVVASRNLGAHALPPLRLHEWVDGDRLAILVDGPARFLSPADGFFDLKDVALTPGGNVLVARAEDPLTGLTGPDSAAVHLTVAPGLFPDLTLADADLSSYPAVPSIGQSARLAAVVRNLGGTVAADIKVTLRLVGPNGIAAFETEAAISAIAPKGAAMVSGFWTPTAAGTYLLQAVVDPAGIIVETAEDNNEASAGVWVVPGAGLAAIIEADRASYPARSPVAVQVQVVNGGMPFAGLLRTTVEDAAGHEVALLDVRDAPLEFGRTIAFSVPWNTGTTYAGGYTFRVRALEANGPVAAEASRSFSIRPDISLVAHLMPEGASVGTGDPARFAARVESHGVNAPLDDLRGRLRIVPEGSATPLFESAVPIPRLLPGSVWESTLAWPASAPAGRYTAELSVMRSGSTLAVATAPLTVSAAGLALGGTLRLDPAAVLVGAILQAQVTVVNRATSAISGVPVKVELTSGPAAMVIVAAALSLDLAPGEQRSQSVPLSTTGVGPGAYSVLLRAGDPALTLDRATLRVHGAITAPSIDSPADGARVSSAHPALIVNNASSPEAAVLAYEFQLFSDAGLTQPLPAASGVAEGLARTSWTVAVNLIEDQKYYWRARATDGFSLSPWTAAGAFTVDTVNMPPSAPVPDAPFDEARVASRQAVLTVSNAQDPELDPLFYEFRLHADPSMSSVITSVTGVPSGPGLTSWAVPLTLDENATYFWSARATDGQGFSPWSVPISFMVDTVNESPSAPGPIAPVGGIDVPSLTPELVVANARDPENDALSYRFEIDTVASFDSPARQASPPAAEGNRQTVWMPSPLADNTLHYWRAAASDGHTSSPWAGGSFFVNLTNDPPGVPVLVDPVDGRTVATATPTLRLHNTTDPDHDALTYEFEVRASGGALVASTAGVAEAAAETAWVVPMPLAEDASFTWRARANDGEVSGGWSAPASFHVNAAPSPPTAPRLVSPSEASTVDAPRPTLVVANATSPEGFALTYAFELYAVGADGTPTLLAQATEVPEGVATTSWPLPLDLADGDYAWRSRAVDSLQAGPWMASAHFRARVDVPPAPPSGLQATPGDRRVALAWSASPELDVVGYRVYRGTVAGGPYGFVAATTTPLYVDLGLVNGVTVRYVVTAADARFESTYSVEAAATPAAPPPAVITAQVRFTPATIEGVCLLAEDDDDDDRPSSAGPLSLPPDSQEDEDECPQWLYVTIELPAGVDPARIERATVRLAGSITPDPSYSALVDEDHDGNRELKVRFAFRELRSRLAVGPNVLRITGRVLGSELRGDGTVQVTLGAADLWITPRTLSRKSKGDAVQAQITFHPGTASCEVSLASVRLNETVPVQRRVSCQGSRITVKFDRAAAIAVLPVGDHAEVRVTGTLRGLGFIARDFIRVIP